MICTKCRKQMEYCTQLNFGVGEENYWHCTVCDAIIDENDDKFKPQRKEDSNDRIDSDRVPLDHVPLR